jgi:uncharacterized membrane protein
MKLNEKFWTIIICAICLVYVLIRFWHLSDSCLWFDEIFSIHAAEMGWKNLFWFVAQDLIHPPLFYIFLKIWIHIGGETLYWLRLFPVLFATIALIPFFLLCRQLKLKQPTIVLALLFFAVNGNLVKYAQEVRMYSVLLCLSLFSFWLFARYLNVGKGIWFLTIVNILLVHTQYFGWFLVLAEVFALLYLQRVKIGQFMVMFGLVIASFIPWTIAVLQAARSNADVSQNLGWASKPDLLTLIRFIFNFNEPFYFQTSNINPLTIWQITLPILLIIITAVFFYFANWKNYDEKEKNAFSFLLIILFTPILLAFIASWILPFSIWGTRHFIIIFAPYTILLAKIFSNIQFKVMKISLISAIIAIILGAFILQLNRPIQTPIWCAWDSLADNLYESTLHGKEASDIAVYTFEDLTAYHFWFSLHDSDRGFRIFKVNGFKDLIEDKAYFLPRGFDGVKTINADEINELKFYIAFRAEDFNYLKPPLKFLIEKGYKIGDPQIYETNGLKAFLVEVKK